MCGIAGTLSILNESITSALIGAIVHRGPDERPRYYQADGYSAAVCRLSIVGRKSGSQPMLSDSGDICVSFNGEIYNHQQLRAQLLTDGQAFSTESDTEVLLRGYEAFGISFISQLEGMFAIAVFDRRKGLLFLVRDRLGIKPLYYLKNRYLMAYSSEVKSFFSAGLSSGEVDEDYLAYRFVFNFGPINRTLFTDIRPVLPGSVVQFSIEGSSLVENARSWHVPTTGEIGTPSSEHLKQLVVKSVSEQIPDEVPWGIFLSGGLDSSILTYLGTLVENCPPVLLTVTDGSESEDLRQARRVAGFLGAELIELSSTPAEIIDLLPQYVLASEEFEPLSIFWYLLGKGASKFIKVALCGQGADELFGGYPIHHDPSLLLTATSERFRLIEGRGSADIQELIAFTISKLRSEDAMSYLYDFFLRDQLVSFQLNPVDKCTMAHGVEARVPYLSGRLLDYFRSLSPAALFKNEHQEKSLLRRAFVTSRLPNLTRQKQFSGLHTLPAYHLAVNELADQLVTSRTWNTHPFAIYMKGKLEMLSLDILLHAFRECKASIPSQFRLSEIYE
jgi:asparagine synthase (glutamine-hydrolysing)